MAYYGNLALRPERKPQQTPPPARQTEKIVRRRQLPVGEKLLYLFTVAVCAVVAGLIIYRYAEIYQMNRQIQDMNRTYEQTVGQMKELQREVERLSEPKRIIDEARKLGYVQLDPNRGITVGENGNAVAMDTKK
ncbi:cell division initiation protein [Cohnella sp. CFH 77786]|uniref:cell division protein FtsL n=1 Tax=Cohnella sp. CFH 77786 TaxID=2662265 RepID=UPI001C60EAC3|nr:septum formation initiator family protein [Cohnella sp. CFH 77786]MBW5444836.1 cell division initiation protein [Cohnella sp. CFH 77786]